MLSGPYIAYSCALSAFKHASFYLSIVVDPHLSNSEEGRGILERYPNSEERPAPSPAIFALCVLLSCRVGLAALGVPCGEMLL